MFLLLLQMDKTGTDGYKNQTSPCNKNEQKKVKESDGPKKMKAVGRNSQASISFYYSMKVKVT